MVTLRRTTKMLKTDLITAITALNNNKKLHTLQPYEKSMKIIVMVGRDKEHK